MKLTTKTFVFFAWLTDAVLLLLLYLYLSGGLLFLNEAALNLIGQKPWIHRIFSTACLMGCFFIYRFHPGGNLRQDPDHFKSPLLNHLKLNFLSDRVRLWIIFLVFSVLMTFSSWVRHGVFRTSFDMAIFTQAIWSLTQGHLLYSSIKGGICLLADHFSPLLIPLAVPYFIWPDPRVILMIQAFSAGATVFAIYKLAQYKLEDKTWALAFSAAFVLYLPVRNSVRFDFHPEVLVIPLLVWAFYLIERSKLLWATAVMILCLFSKENAALVTFGLGFYAFIFKKGSRLFGLAWILFSFAYLMFIIYWFIPNIFGSEYIYLGGNYFSWKEKGIIPLISYLLRQQSIIYLVKVFAPLGFLSFLWPPTLMLTFPILLQNLMTGTKAHTSIFFQYTVYLTPFVFIAAIYGAATVKKWCKPSYLLFFAFLFTGVSEFYVIHQYEVQKLPYDQAIKTFADELDPAYSVRTHELLAPHFANRRKLHIFENNHPQEGGSAKALNADYVILDDSLLDAPKIEQLNELTKRGYRLDSSGKHFYIFTRIETA